MSIDPQTLAATADLMAALAHPGRLGVVMLLHNEGALSAGALGERLGIEASALSHQLRALRDAKLIRVVPEGRKRVYHLHDEHVACIVADAIAHVCE